MKKTNNQTKEGRKQTSKQTIEDREKENNKKQS